MKKLYYIQVDQTKPFADLDSSFTKPENSLLDSDKHLKLSILSRISLEYRGL